MQGAVSTLDYAIALACRGCKVFRLKSGTKDFFIDKTWADEPLDDLSDILAAFTRKDGTAAGYNLGVNAGASDLVIVDVDLKPDLDGFANLATLGALPRTYTVRSPSGGKHFYFKANGLKLAQSPLGPGIDIRSHHGYVVGPGSVTAKGQYVVEDDSDFADLPQWIIDRTRQKGSGGQNVPLFEPDSEEDAIDEATAFVKAQPLTRQGAVNNTLIALARDVFDFGISVELATDIIAEHFVADPMPPAEEIAAIVERADDSYEGPRGKSFAGFGFEPLVKIEPPKDDELAARFAEKFKISNPAISEADEKAIELRPWLIKRRMLKGKLGELVAPGGIGKSLLTCQWAIALALGPEVGALLGCEVTEACNVLMMNNEDETDEINRRLSAICKYYRLDRKKVAERVFILSGADNPIALVTRAEKNKLKEETAIVNGLVAFIRFKNVGAWFGDPLVELHEADENSNNEMVRVMAVLRKVAVLTKTAGLVVHHTRKPGGSEGNAGNADVGRGASAIVNAVRVASTLYTMTEKDAQKFGVPEDRRQWYLRLDSAKANLSEPSSSAEWFEKVSVKLANGESVGVLVPKQLTAAEVKDREAIAREVAALLSDGPLSVGAAAKYLAESDLFDGNSASSLIKRIAKAFGETESIDTPRGRVLFVREGKEGGEFSILPHPN